MQRTSPISYPGMLSGLEDGIDFDILISISLLEKQEKYYEGTENGPVLKDHARSLKNGLQFLGKLYPFLWNEESLAIRVKGLAAYMKHTLTAYENENGVKKEEDDEKGVLDLMQLDHAYAQLRGRMMGIVIEPGIDLESLDMIRLDCMRIIIDLLIENTAEVLHSWYNNNDATTDDQTAALVNKVAELRMALTYYKPLYRCVAHNPYMFEHLYSVLNGAAVAIYLLFVGKMDEEIVVSSLQQVMSFDKQCRDLNIYVRFLKFASLEFSSDVKGQFYILDNLIHILAMNLDSLNDANNYLYTELRELRSFVGNQSGNETLKHYLGLTASTESICYQALPIVYSCYMEELDIAEDMHQKLNDIIISVISQIKMIKRDHGSQEIKLYDYPRVDCLGFLEYFMGNLKELQGREQTSLISREIEALHTSIHCLVSSSPETSQGAVISKELWSHIVRLAYQAEYVMDLYLVVPDSRCISSLSKIVEEVKEIKEELLALPDRSLHVKDVALTTSIPVHATPLHVNDVLVGFQEEIVAIKKYLITGESDLQVISVVGMAGAGKTSLAKHLFEESSIVEHFDRKAWCTVSQTYQTKYLLLTILNQINSSNIRDMDDQDLADDLCRSLKRRRYLVVIDDVWDVSLWNSLRQYFPGEKTQSRILITTRDSTVASETKSKIHQLRALTEDESWELLQKKLPEQESLPKYIESIAKEVAKSCKGLPLSIVIIGSLLHNAARNEEMCNQIAKDVTSTILSDPRGECKAILELSYNHLPDNLKSCFLYLGVFPEDQEISVTRLVRLWVAEGLVRGRMASDVGKGYANDLITRSLVIPRKGKVGGGVRSFQLHDLLRDFCLKKAKEENFFSALELRGVFHWSHCPRRISINRGVETHLPSFSWNSVRTVISSYYVFGIEQIMRYDRMLLLNVLDVPKLDDPACYLPHYVHLRYLAVWSLYCDDRVFVESLFSKLLNLQVLILYFVSNTSIELPKVIWDLVKLRHIDIRPRASLPYYDSMKIEDSTVLLENLKSLSKVNLVCEDENWLRKLPELQKLSCTFFLGCVPQDGYPELDVCNRLTSLKVDHGPNRSETVRRRCKLHLPANLSKLSLKGFDLDSDGISEIGKSLPNLEVLKLRDCIEKWSVNDEFPELKVLEIVGPSTSFDEWDASEDSFPKLEQLWLQYCDRLEEIPLSFGDIPNLRLISVKHCNPRLCMSAWEIEKIQVEAQNLVLKVIIYPPIKPESVEAY